MKLVWQKVPTYLGQQGKIKCILKSFQQRRSQYLALAKCKIAKFYMSIAEPNFMMTFYPYGFVCLFGVFSSSKTFSTYCVIRGSRLCEMNRTFETLCTLISGKDFLPQSHCSRPPTSLPSLIWLGLSSPIPSSYMNHFQHWVLIIIYKVTF